MWVWWWLAFVGAVSLLRIVAHHALGGAMRATVTPERQILIAGLGMLAAAGCWAVLAWLLLTTPDPLVRYSASIVFAGMAAGAIGILAPFSWIGPFYITLLMVPGCVRLMTLPGQESVIGVLGLIFAGVMIVGHRANRMLLLQSVQLGQRNNELMAETRTHRDPRAPGFA